MTLRITRVVNCVGKGGVGIRPELAENPLEFYRRGYERCVAEGCDEVEFAWAFGRQNYGLLNPLRAGQGRFYHKDQKPLREAMWTFLDWLHTFRSGHVPVRVGLGFPPKNWRSPGDRFAFDDVSGRPALFLDRTVGYDVIGESVPVDNVARPGLARAFNLPKGHSRIVWRVRARIVKQWLRRHDEAGTSLAGWLDRDATPLCHINNGILPTRLWLDIPPQLNLNILFTGDPDDAMSNADLDRLRPLLHGVTLMNAPANVEEWARGAR